MARVKRGLMRHKRHKKVLKKASGYFGRKSRTFKNAHEQVMKSGNYAFRDRRAKKRAFRRLWITRINAASRLSDLSYSQFMHGLSEAGVGLDRKVLAEIAVEDPRGFEALANTAKTALA